MKPVIFYIKAEVKKEVTVKNNDPDLWPASELRAKTSLKVR